MQLSDLLAYIAQPQGGPVFAPLPKAQSNATGASIPGVKTPPLSSPSDFMNALTAASRSQYENELARQQAALYGIQGQTAQATLGVLQRYPELLRSMFRTGASSAEPAPANDVAAFGAPAPTSLDINSEFKASPSPRVALPAGVGGAARNAGDEWLRQTPAFPINAAALDQTPSTFPAAVTPPSLAGSPQTPQQLAQPGWREPPHASLASLALPPGAPPARGNAPIFGNLAGGQRATASKFGIAAGLPGLENFDPVQAAMVGSMLEAYKLPNAAAPLLGLYTGSPGYKAAVSSAEKWAGVAPELATKWNSPMVGRAGGGIMNPATGQVVGAMPTIHEVVDPVTKDRKFVYMTPPTAGSAGPQIIQTGATAALGPEDTARLEAQGKAGVKYGDLLPGASPRLPMGTAMPNPSASPGSGPIPLTVKPTIPLSEQYMPQSPSQIDEATPKWQGVVDKWTEAIEPARQAEMRLLSIAQAYKMTEAGSYATDKARLAGVLKSIGIDPALVTETNPAAVQEALHQNYLQTLVRLKTANSRFTGQEFAVTSSYSEHPNIQPEANLNMLSQDVAIVRHAQQLPADWNVDQKFGWRNPISYETAWTQRHPLISAAEQVKKEIGPLKGMSAGAGAASPAPNPTKTVGGVTYTKIDGVWHAP